MTKDEHAEKVIRRATTDVASIVDRYKQGDIPFGSMVDTIEVRINSMIGSIDSERLDEWRSHWNRLEFVNASLIDDGRSDFATDEREMVDDALDALESMTRH